MTAVFTSSTAGARRVARPPTSRPRVFHIQRLESHFVNAGYKEKDPAEWPPPLSLAAFVAQHMNVR